MMRNGPALDPGTRAKATSGAKAYHRPRPRLSGGRDCDNRFSTRRPGGRGRAMAKILLVEDNDMNRDMLSRRLQRKGYEVLMAADGMQAILMAESETPDIILLDMSLPVIDGWEAARRLKASPTTARVPIVALTAHAMSGDREKALAAGCDEYDTKPVDFPQFVAKIEALLAR